MYRELNVTNTVKNGTGVHWQYNEYMSVTNQLQTNCNLMTRDVRVLEQRWSFIFKLEYSKI